MPVFLPDVAVAFEVVLNDCLCGPFPGAAAGSQAKRVQTWSTENRDISPSPGRGEFDQTGKSRENRDISPSPGRGEFDPE